MTKKNPEALQELAENLFTTLSVVTRCDVCPEPCPCRRCIGEEEARCGDICRGCRGSKFCGFGQILEK